MSEDKLRLQSATKPSPGTREPGLPPRGRRTDGLPSWCSWLSHRAAGHLNSSQEDNQHDPQGSKDANLSGLPLMAP